MVPSLGEIAEEKPCNVMNCGETDNQAAINRDSEIFPMLIPVLGGSDLGRGEILRNDFAVVEEHAEGMGTVTRPENDCADQKLVHEETGLSDHNRILRVD